MNVGAYVYRVSMVLLVSCVLLPPAYAIEWSRTELHLQYGNLAVPTFAGGGDSEHFIYTLQHASGWQYGDTYFFIDVLDARNPGFQAFDLYGEWYSNFSLGKILNQKVGVWIVSDVGILLGFNGARDPKVKKYLPGLRFSLDLDGLRLPISILRRTLTIPQACLPEASRGRTMPS